MTPVGPIGRLGRWTARNARVVFAAWAIVAIALGISLPWVMTRLIEYSREVIQNLPGSL